MTIIPEISRKDLIMKYSIRVNEVKKEDGNVRGFATVVFGDSFKITNIAIVENKDKGQLFVSMPRYRSREMKAVRLYIRMYVIRLQQSSVKSFMPIS